jgi:hypothetical protein
MAIVKIYYRNLKIHCNPHQNSSVIFHQNRKVTPKIHVEALSTPSSQDNQRIKSNTGGIIIPKFKFTTEP